METGDFSQFGLNGQNASSKSGNASKKIITSTVKQGQYALRLTSTGEGSAERMRQDRAVPGGTGARNLPDDGYWSVWFYPETYASMGEGNAYINLFQFKQKYEKGGEDSSRYLHAWYLQDVGVEGEYGLQLKTRISSNGKEWGDKYKRVVASSDLDGNRIKVGEWNHIEVRYKYGDVNSGRVTTWINGELVWDLQNHPTEFSDWPFGSYRRQHLFNVYIVGPVSPAKQSIVFDAGRVQTTRHGPS